MTIAAMKQALECLESLAAEPPGVRALHLDAVVIQNLRAAIEQAEKAEPVAWLSPGKERLEFARKDTVYGSHTIPLYKHPLTSSFSVGVIDADGYLYPDHPLEPGTVLYIHPAPVPAGWQLVPVEPTPDMVIAGNDAMASPNMAKHTVRGCYKAMLAAAPKPVKPTDDRSHDVKHSVKVSKRQTLGN